ncbi:serine protease [Myxococcus sp. K38C18041901]|uniref:S1 family peptidase n=1 Tax=Myxococcus guangdongensis TaxID=2906760 RepID=UPI0020A7CCF2|nr:serine protease [Myxococcus guangdongensis]MCP3060474.1 serine protease [Myxococcus guangdongensis]
MAEGVVNRSPPRDTLFFASPSLVLLEVDGRRASGFLATEQGHLVTSLHAVCGAREIHAVMADGTRTEVVQVAAMDDRRDLAVLRLPISRLAPPLDLSPVSLPGEGDTVYVLRATASPAPEVRSQEVRAVQVLGDWLTLLELTRTLPDDFSGGPVVDLRGGVVGVATAALANGRSLGLVIPTRYLLPLLHGAGSLPLSALDTPRRRAGRVRHVPRHPMSLLDGASADALESIATTLGHAINAGAPAYNRGDVDGCYRLYARTAERLIATCEAFPGAQRALRDGLSRCAGLQDSDDRAWALRDAFDGLLDVIGRWLQARPPAPRPSPKSSPSNTSLVVAPATKHYLN